MQALPTDNLLASVDGCQQALVLRLMMLTGLHLVDYCRLYQESKGKVEELRQASELAFALHNKERYTTQDEVMLELVTKNSGQQVRYEWLVCRAKFASLLFVLKASHLPVCICTCKGCYSTIASCGKHMQMIFA